MLPLQVAGLRIERLQKSRRVQIVACSHQQVVADNHGRHRRKILLGEIGDFLVPPLFSGLRIEADQIIVRRLHVEPVALHRHSAIADVRPALRSPEIVPMVWPSRASTAHALSGAET